MIEFHADDYGLFIEQSKRILHSMDQGVINGISIMPNSPYLDECMELLGNRKYFLATHLNLVEGKPLTAVPHLSKKGIFAIGFGKLLVVSYIPFVRKIYQKEIQQEWKAQLLAVQKYHKAGYRLDSHCHFHMVPVVFDAMIAAVKEIGIPVDYIRMPREPLEIYRRREGREKIPPINIVKVALLNLFYHRNVAKHKAYLLEKEENCKTLANRIDAGFLGVMYSGNMNCNNVPSLYQKVVEKGGNWEILFHPGAVYEPEDIAQLTSKDDIHFLTSENRKAEAEASLRMKEYR